MKGETSQNKASAFILPSGCSTSPIPAHLLDEQSSRISDLADTTYRIICSHRNSMPLQRNAKDTASKSLKLEIPLVPLYNVHMR